ncbi:MAG TPA: hypothetical protein PLD36_10005, partial [Bacteroidia bacterium]|nr:hypothetical protein [Bacteroidia bacterium]
MFSQNKTVLKNGMIITNAVSEKEKDSSLQIIKQLIGISSIITAAAILFYAINGLTILTISSSLYLVSLFVIYLIIKKDFILLGKMLLS